MQTHSRNRKAQPHVSPNRMHMTQDVGYRPTYTLQESEGEADTSAPLNSTGNWISFVQCRGREGAEDETDWLSIRQVSLGTI